MSPENRETILLAEDEQPVRTFILAMLRMEAYEVITAVDGQDALEKSRKYRGPIHLLLSDVQMPNMTGVELAQQIQAERPEIKVLLMSGMPSGMLLLNQGWQFLPKPFMSDLLRKRVRAFLDGGSLEGSQSTPLQ